MFSPPLGTDTVPDSGGVSRETRLQVRTQDFCLWVAVNHFCDWEVNHSPGSLLSSLLKGKVHTRLSLLAIARIWFDFLLNFCFTLWDPNVYIYALWIHLGHIKVAIILAMDDEASHIYNNTRLTLPSRGKKSLLSDIFLCICLICQIPAGITLLPEAPRPSPSPTTTPYSVGLAEDCQQISFNQQCETKNELSYFLKAKNPFCKIIQKTD